MGPASAHLPLLLVSLTTTAAASAAATAASATAAVAAATAMACLPPSFPCGGQVAAALLSFSVFDLTKLHRRFSLGGLAGEELWSVFLRPRRPRNHFDALPIGSEKFWVWRKKQVLRGTEEEEEEGKNRAYE